MKASQAAIANMGLHSGMVSPVGRDCAQDFTRCSKASRPWSAKSSTKSPLAKVIFPTSSEVFFLQYFSIIRSLSHLDLGLPHLSGQFPVHHGESMPRWWLHLVAISQCCKGIVEMLACTIIGGIGLGCPIFNDIPLRLSPKLGPRSCIWGWHYEVRHKIWFELELASCNLLFFRFLVDIGDFLFFFSFYF